MKKTIIMIMAIGLLAVTACKKASTVSGGTWAFKGQTYAVTSGIADLSYNPPVATPLGNSYSVASLSTACSASNAYGSIVFHFYTYPTVSGSYPITANQYPDSGSNFISVSMILATGSNFAQNSYLPSPISAATATANVTVATNGFVTVSIPNLEMVNVDPTKGDSASLTVNVKQTE